MEDAMPIRKDLLLHFFVGAITTGALAALLLLLLPAPWALSASVLTCAVVASAWEASGETPPSFVDWCRSVVGAVAGAVLTLALVLP
jgi:uncharacterized membrane protein AbrB (regulator of aidB expression)